MCTIDTFIERHATVLRDHLGMHCEVSNASNGSPRQILFRINSLWCSVHVTAPLDPELVVIRCQIEVPDMEAEGLDRIVARVNRRFALSKAVAVQNSVVVTAASVAGPPDCLPSIESLVAVLPRLRGVMALSLSVLHDEVEFERLAANSAQTQHDV